MKVCTKCGLKKMLDEFTKSKASRDGHYPRCKSCKRADERERAAMHREEAAAKSRAWYYANLDRAKSSRKAYRESHREEAAHLAAVYREKNRERIRARAAVWRSENAEKVSEYQHAWYEANRERVLTIRRSYAETNWEAIQTYQRTYRIQNGDRIRARQSAYYKEHRDEIQSKAAEHYAAHRDVICAKVAAYRSANSEKIREQQACYRQEHREDICQRRRAYMTPERRAANAERVRRWNEENPERRAHHNRAHNYRRRARVAAVQGVFGHHTDAQWTRLLVQFGNCCARCGTTRNLTRDHIVPLARGGIDLITNIQPLCGPCNNRKNAKTILYPLYGVTLS